MPSSASCPQRRVRAGPVELLEREEGRNPPMQRPCGIRCDAGQKPGRLRRRAAAEDLTLAVKARRGIGVGQPVDKLGERSRIRSCGRRGWAPAGRCHAREEADLRPDVDAASPPRQLAT